MQRFVVAVFSYVPRLNSASRIAATFPPLLAHTSNPDETHYFPLNDHDDRRIVLHTHMPAPFIISSQPTRKGVTLDIFSSGLSECSDALSELRITIDWPATLGRWATRYWTSTLVWSIGVVGLVIFYSWDANGSSSLRISLWRLISLPRQYPTSVSVSPSVWKLPYPPPSFGILHSLLPPTAQTVLSWECRGATLRGYRPLDLDCIQRPGHCGLVGFVHPVVSDQKSERTGVQKVRER